MITYAMGDIHGRLDHLTEALAFIEQDAGEQPAHVIFLGDYVDRGPQSKQVLDLLMAGPTKANHVWTPLAGNHDYMILDYVRGEYEWTMSWMDHGGLNTLESFGFTEQAARIRKAKSISIGGYALAIKDNLVRFPDAYIEFIMNLPLYAEDEHRIFVHAGFSPRDGEPLEQDHHTVLWIRREFLDAQHDFGKLIVHGHTPSKSGPEYLPPYRLGLDTGAAIYPNGGRLTVARWAEGETVPTFWQTLPNREQPLTNSEQRHD